MDINSTISNIFRRSTADFSPGGEINTYAEKNLLNFILAYQYGGLDCSNISDNLNTSATREVCYPPSLIFFGAICMIHLAIMSMVGNSVFALALSTSKKLRTVTTAFIVNVCVSDFFYSFFAFIFSIYALNAVNWNGGGRDCKWYNFLNFFFASLSVGTVTAITVNRYVLIVHPQYYQAIFSKRNTAIFISLLWAKSLATILLPYFEVWGTFGYDPGAGECTNLDKDGHSDIYEFIIAYAIPLFLFGLCYAKIFYVVRKNEKNIMRYEGTQFRNARCAYAKCYVGDVESKSADPTHNNLLNESEWRVFKIIMAIFMSYTLCFIPMCVFTILRAEAEYPHLYILSHLGQHLSTVINPIIYVAMNEEYRKAYQELFWRRDESK